MTSQNLWQQMPLLLLPEPNRDIRTELIEGLASELAKEDTVTVKQMIKSHRLDNRETELLLELLQVAYILD